MKGRTNNPNGRPKGIQNKLTGRVKESIACFVEMNFEEVTQIWRILEPKDKLAFYKDLLSYVVPKMQPTRQSGEDQNHETSARDARKKLIEALAKKHGETWMASETEENYLLKSVSKVEENRKDD
jgi:hypothetical protein